MPAAIAEVDATRPKDAYAAAIKDLLERVIQFATTGGRPEAIGQRARTAGLSERAADVLGVLPCGH